MLRRILLLLALGLFAAAVLGTAALAQDGTVQELEELNVLLLGDVIFQDSGVVPGQILTIDTATNNPGCTLPADCGVLLQVKQSGSAVTTLINGAIITLDGTMFVQATPGDVLRILTLAGSTEVISQAGAAVVPPGAQVVVPLGADALVAGSPGVVEPYDEAAVSSLADALALLPTPLEVPPAASPEELAGGEGIGGGGEGTDLGAISLGATPTPEGFDVFTPTPEIVIQPTATAPLPTVAVLPTLAPGDVELGACDVPDNVFNNSAPGALAVRSITFPACIPQGGYADGSFSYQGGAVRFAVVVVQTCENCAWSFAPSYALPRNAEEYTFRLYCGVRSPGVTHTLGLQVFDAAGSSSAVLPFQFVC